MKMNAQNLWSVMKGLEWTTIVGMILEVSIALYILDE